MLEVGEHFYMILDQYIPYVLGIYVVRIWCDFVLRLRQQKLIGKKL